MGLGGSSRVEKVIFGKRFNATWDYQVLQTCMCCRTVRTIHR